MDIGIANHTSRPWTLKCRDGTGLFSITLLVVQLVVQRRHQDQGIFLRVIIVGLAAPNFRKS